MSSISVKRLPSGYWHVRGVGPCNFAQLEFWPCDPKALDAAFFCEAGAKFRADAHEANRQAHGEATDE